MRFEAVVNRLLRRDGDFAREPLRAPREANPAPQLTGDHLFHHARAEALVCGWRHGGAVRFGPTQHDPAVCRATTPPERNHRVPTGHRTWPLVANSCKVTAIACAASGSTIRCGPLIRACPSPSRQ